SVDYRLFKGIVTAKSVYAADYLRSFGDVDILICPANLKKVEALLEEDGFIPADDLYRVFPDEIIQKYSFAQHFIRSEPSNVAVDLHLNMSGCLHPFQFDSADFWDNSSSFSLDGHELQTFDPEHQAVYAIYHAFKHYFFKLIWFIDAFLLLDRSGLDQVKFQALIKKYKLSKLLGYYASITQELFGRLPAVLNDYRLDSRGEHRLINSRTILSGFLPYSPSRARLLLPMYYMKGPFSRFGFLWRQLFPPMETVRDFYVGKNSGKGILSYVKLRCKAITDLCLNKTKEEYSS
ncbi:MAG: nucleotidyltransferase family protein, partial [Candidatus Marinimicrobia bacterium]|nr:nucleotidyltransferase family protein [Candidatus Neomarinimicrobiota bacterium]